MTLREIPPFPSLFGIGLPLHEERIASLNYSSLFPPTSLPPPPMRGKGWFSPGSLSSLGVNQGIPGSLPDRIESQPAKKQISR
ncbi:Hypothetical protein Minf_1696 [Methylacidiphilum infernorum V4]|uniref:Uncharacterized protein n=1 Tax=Methylacidiphilum infernorum (isolate V4) TaxID=481448 RepID=B3DWT7_METI4|nr:Hypothetical protein Minf_1696 [Methylacidiphilum infernorum V4]